MAYPYFRYSMGDGEMVYNHAWDNEDVETLETLNDIFNL